MDEIIEEMEDTETIAPELGIDIEFKTFRKGSYTYIEFKNLTSGLIERYHLVIQKKIISALSDYQLKRLIELCTYEFQRRANIKK